MSACSPAGSKTIAAEAARCGGLPDEDRAGGATDWSRRGRVDEVPGDHPLAGGADGHRRLAGQDPGPGLHRRPERPDRVDELEPGPHRPLGVVLVGDRRAPDGHDGVADELLDRPAVAGDHLAGDLEVAGQGVADLLGVALLGERREPDEVGEEHRDVPPLGDGSGGGREA